MSNLMFDLLLIGVNIIFHFKRYLNIDTIDMDVVHEMTVRKSYVIKTSQVWYFTSCVKYVD